MIQKNPCDFVELPKQRRREADFYTVDELQEMFDCLKDEPLYPLFYLTAIYGLRRSEVLGLKWDSVNFKARTLTIKHTVVIYTITVEKDSTKNDASFRSYPITNEVMDILLSLQQKEAENRTLFGKEYIENDYIFKWDNGKPYSPDYVTQKFSKLLAQHNCFLLKDIQEWLGHADIQTTANIYAHLDVERKNKIAKSMSNAFNF